ncbi:hypothetical protein JCM10207_005734 [Rhodosporidiobolus poonsookiae]
MPKEHKTGKGNARKLTKEELDDAEAAHYAAQQQEHGEGSGHHDDSGYYIKQEYDGDNVLPTTEPYNHGSAYMKEYRASHNAFKKMFDSSKRWGRVPQKYNWGEWERAYFKTFATRYTRYDEPTRKALDNAIEAECTYLQNGGRHPPYHSIGHRTARIYRLDRNAWIRNNNPRLASRAF